MESEREIQIECGSTANGFKSEDVTTKHTKRNYTFFMTMQTPTSGASCTHATIVQWI
jgi:hypothetical protein